jgi:hypothetical protein
MDPWHALGAVDPDCRDDKHGSCIGDGCGCGCHAETVSSVWDEEGHVEP